MNSGASLSSGTAGQSALALAISVMLSDDVEWFLEQARDRCLPVIYDVDDLVFDVDRMAPPHVVDRIAEALHPEGAPQ